MEKIYKISVDIIAFCFALFFVSFTSYGQIFDRDTNQELSDIEYFSLENNQINPITNLDYSLGSNEANLYYLIRVENYYPRIITSNEAERIELSSIRLWGRNTKIRINVLNNSQRPINRVIVDDAFANFSNNNIEFYYPNSPTSVLVAVVFSSDSVIVEKVAIQYDKNMPYGELNLDIINYNQTSNSILASTISINNNISSPNRRILPKENKTIHTPPSKFPSYYLQHVVTQPFSKVFIDGQIFPTIADKSGKLSILLSKNKHHSISIKKEGYFSRKDVVQGSSDTLKIPLEAYWEPNIKATLSFGLDYWESFYSYDSSSIHHREKPIPAAFLPASAHVNVNNLLLFFDYRGTYFFNFRNINYHEARIGVAWRPYIFPNINYLHIYGGTQIHYLFFKDIVPSPTTPNLDLMALSLCLNPRFFITDNQLIEINVDFRIHQRIDQTGYHMPSFQIAGKWSQFRDSSLLWGMKIIYIPRFTYIDQPVIKRYTSNFTIGIFCGFRFPRSLTLK